MSGGISATTSFHLIVSVFFFRVFPFQRPRISRMLDSPSLGTDLFFSASMQLPFLPSPCSFFAGWVFASTVVLAPCNASASGLLTKKGHLLTTTVLHDLLL